MTCLDAQNVKTMADPTLPCIYCDRALSFDDWFCGFCPKAPDQIHHTASGNAPPKDPEGYSFA